MCDFAQVNSQSGKSRSQNCCAAIALRSRVAVRKNEVASFGAKLVQTGAQPVAPTLKACRLVDSQPAISVTLSPRIALIALIRDRSPVLSLIQLTLSSFDS